MVPQIHPVRDTQLRRVKDGAHRAGFSTIAFVEPRLKAGKVQSEAPTQVIPPPLPPDNLPTAHSGLHSLGGFESAISPSHLIRGHSISPTYIAIYVCVRQIAISVRVVLWALFILPFGAVRVTDKPLFCFLCLPSLGYLFNTTIGANSSPLIFVPSTPREALRQLADPKRG